MKSLKLITLILFFSVTVLQAQDTTTVAVKKDTVIIPEKRTSVAEPIFKKYLEKEETTVAKIIINQNDSLYSVFCQGALATNPRDKRRLLTKFITLDPKFGVARAFLYIGVSYAQSNKPDSALFYYNIALRKDSTYLQSYYYRGEIYARMAKYDKAIKDFKQVIKMYPAYTSAYLMRGNCYLSTKDYNNALADFNKVIELDPYSDQAFMLLGVVYRETEDYLIAIEQWKEAKKLNSANTEIADKLIAEVKAKMKEIKAKEKER